MKVSKNVLIIGTYLAEGIDSFDWWQELPNLSDYKTIILDTTKILNFWYMAGRLKQQGGGFLISEVNEQDLKIRSNLNLVNNKLREILEFNFTVYVLYTPSIRVWATSGFNVYTNNWCPILIDTVFEKGKTILVKKQEYEQYFSSFKSWEYYFVNESLDISLIERYYSKKWKTIPSLTAIATNSVNKPLALIFNHLFYAWENDKDTTWSETPEKMGGDLILLPVADVYHTEHLIEILLRKDKIFEETPEPKWVDRIQLPGEASLKKQIAKEKQKLEVVEAEIKKLEDSLKEVEKHKRLLYATGQELQDICKTTLEEIGAKTKSSDVTDEFMIEVEDREALVEVKGNTGSITKDDLSQLIADLAQQIKVTDTPIIIKGILIGNAWRQEPLNERATKDVFTRHVVQYAEAQNIGLLSTVELFKAYCKILEQPECSSEILDKLIGSKGIIRF